MAEAMVRLYCEACGARYTEKLDVTSAPCPDGSPGVHVTVELDRTAVTAWCAAHRAPVVLPRAA